MRLWHEDLIAKLPGQQLLGQHRECAALRGAGWGRKHATVNYVFDHSPYKLYGYHLLIMEEMTRRGYQPNPVWLELSYRGQRTPAWPDLSHEKLSRPIYPEHNQAYLQACLTNLAAKGIQIAEL